MLKGTSYTIDTSARGFYVDPSDASSDEAQQIFVKFGDLKAVFFVRDFDGKYDKKQLQTEWHPEGLEIAVKFKDGEVIEGYTLTAYDEGAPRFHLIPREPGNNVSVLVERASSVQIALGGGLEPESPVVGEGEEAVGQPESPVSKEETLGDFYFHTKNYFAALTEYDKAFKEDPGSRRLRRKVAVSTFNVGVHYVKVKDYKRALQYFDEVLRYEPKNRDARKKIQKLRRIIATESKEEVTA
jgi:tetratricopeptide (TPR) repeat protein